MRVHARTPTLYLGGAPSHLPLQASLACKRARVGAQDGPNLCQLGTERGQRERTHELDLVLELDSVLRECPATCLGHQSDRVGIAGPIGVLDEVSVPRIDPRAADPVALQSTGLQHQAGGQLVVGILEDASERALVRRLRRLPLREEGGDFGLDLRRGSRLQAEPDNVQALHWKANAASGRERELGLRLQTVDEAERARR